MVTVNAIQCPNCKDIIYSRAVHDFHYCSCGYCFIDGGFDYTKIGAKNLSAVTQLSIELPVTKQELHNDWNTQTNKYGWIKYQ